MTRFTFTPVAALAFFGGMFTLIMAQRKIVVSFRKQTHHTELPRVYGVIFSLVTRKVLVPGEMCKHTYEAMQPLLKELDERQFSYSIDKYGRLCLLRKLPADVAHMLPNDNIPKHVLRVYDLYKKGEINKELIGAPKYHDKINLLRRYNLVAAPSKLGASLSPAEKRAKNREYLRQWRHEKRHAIKV